MARLITVLVILLLGMPPSKHLELPDNVAKGLLEEYLASQVKTADYRAGVSQPVLFEPRPQIRPSSGTMDLLVIISKQQVNKEIGMLRQAISEWYEALKRAHFIMTKGEDREPFMDGEPIPSHHEKLRYEVERIKTFDRFPLDNPGDEVKFARDGRYLGDRGDWIACAFCNASTYGNAFMGKYDEKRHRSSITHYPTCPFKLGQPTDNVPATDEEAQAAVEEVYRNKEFALKEVPHREYQRAEGFSPGLQQLQPLDDMEEKMLANEVFQLMNRIVRVENNFDSYVNRSFHETGHQWELPETSRNPYAKARQRRRADTQETPHLEKPNFVELGPIPDQLVAFLQTQTNPITGLPLWDDERVKRFLWELTNSVAIGHAYHRINQINDKLGVLQRNDMLLDQKVHVLADNLDKTIVFAHALAGRTDLLREDMREMARATDAQFRGLYIGLRRMYHNRRCRSRLQAFQTMLTEVEGLITKFNRWLDAIVTGRVTPQMIGPDDMKTYLLEVEKELETMSGVDIPVDWRQSIWSIYPLIAMTPFLLPDFIVLSLQIPLIKTDVDLHLYSVHNLPAIHPKAGITVKYHLEGKYFAVTADNAFVAVPNEHSIRNCERTGRAVCPFKAPLIPRDTCKLCICALFDDIHEDQTERIKELCPVKISNHTQHKAVNLQEGYWAIATPSAFSMYVTCPDKTFFLKVQPPIGFVNLTGGCVGQSSHLFLPAEIHHTMVYHKEERREFIRDYMSVVQSYDDLKIWSYFNFSDETLERLAKQEDSPLPHLPPHLPMDVINKQLETFAWSKSTPWFKKKWIWIAVSVGVIGLIVIGLAFVLVAQRKGTLALSAFKLFRQAPSLSPQKDPEAPIPTAPLDKAQEAGETDTLDTFALDSEMEFDPDVKRELAESLRMVPGPDERSRQRLVRSPTPAPQRTQNHYSMVDISRTPSEGKMKRANEWGGSMQTFRTPKHPLLPTGSQKYLSYLQTK